MHPTPSPPYTHVINNHSSGQKKQQKNILIRAWATPSFCKCDQKPWKIIYKNLVNILMTTVCTKCMYKSLLVNTLNNFWIISRKVKKWQSTHLQYSLVFKFFIAAIYSHKSGCFPLFTSRGFALYTLSGLEKRWFWNWWIVHSGMLYMRYVHHGEKKAFIIPV